MYIRKDPKTHCQNVSGSWSCKHSGPNPNLNEETDHFAKWPMSGHGSTGGFLAVLCFFFRPKGCPRSIFC
jgi:hypothetical protein